jgi:hypothetical protein
MDFALIMKREDGKRCYKLLRSNFYRGYFVIIAQDKSEFACGSISGSTDFAIEIFLEIATSRTDPSTLHDILYDLERQEV